jgi:GTPase SAR1 family protein
MESAEFQKRVKAGLKNRTEKERQEFAWRCAVRAVPFLGANGNFDFWKKSSRRKHLYRVFSALDYACRFQFGFPVSTPRESSGSPGTATAANAAAQEAFVTASTLSYADDASAANASGFAASASAAAVAINAYSAYSDFYNVAKYFLGELSINGFQLLILDDLNTDKNRQTENTGLALYGEIWTNFVAALKKEECEYWGQLYQNIFESGFKVDLEAWKRRINVPKEIKVQGADVVARYLVKLEKGAERLNEARIIILGDKGSGKTCLARRLVDPEAPMTTDEESTPGVDVTLWKLQEEKINVRIWDFAGHTVTHAVHKFFLSERCLYILVYNGRTDKRQSLEYWLNHMKNYGGDSKAIILVNKKDDHRVDIPVNALREQYPILDVETFSIRDDKSDLMKFRKKVAGYIIHNPSWSNQLIPVNYFKVKEQIENLFQKGEEKRCEELIEREKFDAIASGQKIQNTEELLADLHALGVILWYKEMKEYNTLVLNPEWISHGVYKIINQIHNEKRYQCTLHDLSLIFGGEPASAVQGRTTFTSEYHLPFHCQAQPGDPERGEGVPCLALRGGA